MSGDGTFAGTQFQSRVIAYVYVHILGQTRLAWLTATDDTPLGISAETGGPGDDARIDFGDRCSPLEVQVKYRLNGGEAFKEALADIARRTKHGRPTVALAVDSNSSRKVRVDLARDLEQLRSGRADGLTQETRNLLSVSDDFSAILKSLRISVLDLELDQGAHAKQAFQSLELLLEEKSQAGAAWRVLQSDAAELCRLRQKRTRRELIGILQAEGIKVRPLGAEEHRQLDVSRDLIEGYHSEAALAVLSRLDEAIKRRPGLPEPFVLYRLHNQQALAYLQLGNHERSYAIARKAVDIDPHRVQGLVTAANAALNLGDLTVATELVRLAIGVAPQEVDVWVLEIHVAFSRGIAPQSPPPSISESLSYRAAQAEVARMAGDWHRVEAIARALLQDGHRRYDVLNLLAAALLQTHEGRSDRTSGLMEIERLTTEVIDGNSNLAHPVLRWALSIRFNGRHLRGAEGASADLQRLREWNGDEPEVVHNSAVMKVNAGDLEGALAELQRPVVLENPGLLLLRAGTSLMCGRRDSARKDLEASEKLLAHEPRPAWLCSFAEVAVGLGEIDLAERTIASLAGQTSVTTGTLISRARIAAHRGAIDQAVQLFREAANSQPSSRRLTLVELGVLLRRKDRADEAVEVLSEAGGSELPTRDLREYVIALIQANRLEQAWKVLEKSADSSGGTPEWGVAMMVDIAVRAEEPELAIAQLEKLANRRGTRASEWRIEFARQLAEAGRDADAIRELRMVLAIEALSPPERMNAAQILAYLGDEDLALNEALRAFRESPHDAQFHRALIHISQMDRRPPVNVDEVAPETHVVLSGAGDKTIEYTIYSKQPVDRHRGEMLATDAQEAGLLGKKVGEYVVWRAGSFDEKRWVITKISSALQQVVADAWEHYEERFPGQPFVRAFQAPDGTSVGEWSPMLGAVEQNRKIEEEALALYRGRMFPLGWLAQRLHSDVATVMGKISSMPDRENRLLVEFSDAGSHSAATQAASDAPQIVLTRSALETAQRLGILDLLSGLRVLAPRTMLRELMSEVRENERKVANGTMSMGGGSTGLVFYRLEPGAKELVDRAQGRKEALEWCRTKAVVRGRPLQLLAKVGSQEDELREMVGTDSWDALELAIDADSPMWADDLGLRQIPIQGRKTKSFSTVGFLLSLVRRQQLSEDKCCQMFHSLILWRYSHVPISPKLLVAALNRYHELGRAAVAEVFDTVATMPNVSVAGRLLARTVRDWALAPVLTISLEAAARLGLEAASKKWPFKIVARQISEAAAAALALMPQALTIVQNACADFARTGPGVTPVI
jgi:tetratricopeptide (TPR) repeat protein